MSDAGVLLKAVVVRPASSLERETPMQGESSPIVERAVEQHKVFVGRLRAAGVDVTVFEAATPLAPGVGDLAVLLGEGAFLMRPTDSGRWREVAAIEQLLCDLKIPVLGRLESPGLLDGGDVIVAQDTVFVGVAHRNVLGRKQFRVFVESMGFKCVEVPLSAEVPRLRSVASLLDAQMMLYAPRVVDGAAFSHLRTVQVPAGEEFGAGVLPLGRRRVLANLRFNALFPLVRKAKVSVDAIDLWEFGKIGLTPASLVLALKRG